MRKYLAHWTIRLPLVFVVLLCAALPAPAQTVIAYAVSGNSDYEIGSQPIANVAATDTIGGAIAILGTGGNATVKKVPTWPPGITLNPATGTVSTAMTLALGTYTMQYDLCAASSPTDCDAAYVTVNVVTKPVLVAASYTATVDSGNAAIAIPDVTANDSVNGGKVILGAGGNAQIQVYKGVPWPNGIGLNPTNGQVSIKKTSADGPWAVQYQLCDLNTPAQCVTGNITLTIISASILANPVTCTGSPGETPCNVVSEDTVNGAAVTLPQSNNGNPVNAQLTIDGSAWPPGIELNSGTGAIATSKSLPPGDYNLQYKLCDLNVPANCGANTVTLGITSPVIANAQAKTELAGKALTIIANLAQGDTVFGQPARLVTSPNATVSEATESPYGPWPTGITLNTATGAVTMASSVLPGDYFFTYQLCSIASPTQCAVATNSLTVENSVVAVQNAGSALFGSPSTAIYNLTANDTVNNMPVVLGTNATVAPYGNWPSGISLNTSTGAVTVSNSVAVGQYPLTYQLCNLQSTCVQAPVNISITTQFAEVSVAPYMTGDIEFDWARDGVYCASCNFGSSNSQLNWTDRLLNLWVSGVDYNTGAFTPPSGDGSSGLPIDQTTYFWQDWGNGPEWAFSTPAGSSLPISQLVYTKWSTSAPQPIPPSPPWPYAGAAIATQVNATTWNANFLPGAYTYYTNVTDLPEASQCLSDNTANVVFEGLHAVTEMFTEQVSQTATGPVLAPFGSIANGIGERWVPCSSDSPYTPATGSRWLTFQGDVTIGTTTFQQVFWYDLDKPQAAQPLTFDQTTKQRAVLFKAPDFPDANGNAQYVLMTLAADDQIQIYLQEGTSSYGAPNMVLVNTIYSPDPAEPYMFDPKAFIHCNSTYPQCRTYVVMGLSAEANSQQTETEPNGLAVAAIDPKNPMFKILVTAQSSAMQRLDPKYFITGQYGPVVYYDQFNISAGPNNPYNDNGIFMINLQLDPPYGPCVGSSPEEGLNPTWNYTNWQKCTIPNH
jgi:hypothetical protein